MCAIESISITGQRTALNRLQLLYAKSRASLGGCSYTAKCFTRHYCSDFCTCNLYRCVYFTHNIYAHQAQLLMFIYIQIINLIYRYVLFYANAIKVSSGQMLNVMLGYDRNCHNGIKKIAFAHTANAIFSSLTIEKTFFFLAEKSCGCWLHPRCARCSVRCSACGGPNPWPCCSCACCAAGTGSSKLIKTEKS